jgi:chemotaxis protein CheX
MAGPVKVQVINRYVSAAADVLAKETGAPVARRALELEANPYTTDEVTSVVGVSGAFAGSVYLSMSERTALGVVSIMLGQETTVFDDLAQSGIAELANVVAGSAGVALSNDGHVTDISPPILVVGAGARMSSVEIQRLVVPIETVAGTIKIHIALREAA